MFTEVAYLIKEMIEAINKIRQNRDANSSAVKDQKRIIENEIHELRTEINTHLDKLQDDLMKKLTEAEKTCNERSNDFTPRCHNLNREYESKQTRRRHTF